MFCIAPSERRLHQWKTGRNDNNNNNDRKKKQDELQLHIYFSFQPFSCRKMQQTLKRSVSSGNILHLLIQHWASTTTNHKNNSLRMILKCKSNDTPPSRDSPSVAEYCI